MSQWLKEEYADPENGLHVMRREAAKALAGESIEGDIFQFGVWCGHSMVAILKIWERTGLPFGTLWGFDSFEGLPAGAEAESMYDAAWVPGAFSAATDFETGTVMEAVEKVRARLTPLHGGARVKLVPGFWNISLEGGPHADMSPAQYIDIDADLYTSSVLALDYVFRNKLYQAGTILAYHDWGTTPDFAGEKRAHREMTQKYQIQCKEIWSNGGNTVFKIL